MPNLFSTTPRDYASPPRQEGQLVLLFRAPLDVVDHYEYEEEAA